MTVLLGQVGLKNPQLGLSLLKYAADQVDVDAPQHAYVYGMPLPGEFDQADLRMPIIMATLPPASAQNPDSRPSEAHRRIERAAYLNFAPTQYKLAWGYGYAKSELHFNPLLSVQSTVWRANKEGRKRIWHSASGSFVTVREHLKKTRPRCHLRRKAAGKGLPGAEFAMGHYCETDIGGPKTSTAAPRCRSH